MSMLVVKNLQVEFKGAWGSFLAVSDVSLEVDRGEILGLVGESGAGKSVIGNAITGLIEPPGRVVGGEILLEGRRIDNVSEREMRGIRGGKIGAIFQDPLTSLDPLFTIGAQLLETIRSHHKVTRIEAKKRALEILAEVGIPSPAERFDHFPHEFSGGMRQRIVIALSLSINPLVIIADEPTTALDVSTQAQIVELLRQICRDRGAAVVLITHDLGVIAEAATKVAVIYAGRVVEAGPVRDVIERPQHPYTYGLMSSIPRIGSGSAQLFQIDGHMPRLNEVPRGCSFSPRCPRALDRCFTETPVPVPFGASSVACWLYPPPK